MGLTGCADGAIGPCGGVRSCKLRFRPEERLFVPDDGQPSAKVSGITPQACSDAQLPGEIALAGQLLTVD
jgi:hypothetical protein